MKTALKFLSLFSIIFFLSQASWGEDAPAPADPGGGSTSGEGASGQTGAQPWEQMCAEIAQEQMKNDPPSVQKLFQALTQIVRGGGGGGGAGGGGGVEGGQTSNTSGGGGGCPTGNCGGASGATHSGAGGGGGGGCEDGKCPL